MRHVYPCTTPSPHYYGPQRSSRTRVTHPYLLISEEVTLYTAADRGRVQESSSSWHSLHYLRCQEQRASPLVSGALLLLLALGAFRGPHRWSPGSPQIGTLSCCCGRQVRFMVTRGWQERPKLSANMALGLIFKVPKAGTPRSRRCTQPAPPPLAWLKASPGVPGVGLSLLSAHTRYGMARTGYRQAAVGLWP